jgi:lysophospholipase L1-like esterase
MAKSDAEAVAYMQRAGTRLVERLKADGDLVAEAEAIAAEAREGGDPVEIKLADSLTDYARGLAAAAKAPENVAAVALHKAGIVPTIDLVKRLSSWAASRSTKRT